MSDGVLIVSTPVAQLVMGEGQDRVLVVEQQAARLIAVAGQGPAGPAFAGFGFVRYVEAASDAPVVLSPGVPTQVSMTIDPMQTVDSRRPPFSGFQFWDGQNLKAKASGDAMIVRLTLTATSMVSGGDLDLEVVGGGAVALSVSQALPSQAGVAQRIAFEASLGAGAILSGPGATLQLRSTVPVTVSTETVQVTPLSSGV